MKDIRLNGISLENFKGVTNRRVYNFFGKDAYVYGDNGTGKTTIADAFSWALFGKDSDSKTAFDIKPNTLERPAIAVTLVLTVDEKEVELTRILEETWAVSREDGEEKFTGNKTSYLINKMPKSGTEYKAYVDSIASEDLFRRLSDARVFLSMKKQDMRKTLIDMVGGISNKDVAKDNKAFAELVIEMEDKEYTPEDLLKLVKQNITTATTEQKTVQTRIDEIRNMMPEQQDWDKISEGFKKGETYLAEIDTKLGEAKDVMAMHSKMATTKERIESYRAEAIRNENKDRADTLALKERIKGTIDGIELRLSAQKSTLSNAVETMDSIKEVMTSLKEEYEELSSRRNILATEKFEPFGEGAMVCDKCGQDLPADRIDDINLEAEEKFNKQKAEELARLDKRIEELRSRAGLQKVRYTQAQITKDSSVEQVEKLQDDLSNEKSRLIVCNNKLESMPEIKGDEIDLSDDEVYKELQRELSTLEKHIADYEITPANQLLADKEKVLQQVASLRSLLERKTEREKTETRITELIEQGKELAKTAAKERKRKVTVENFLRQRAELLEENINNHFTTISFRLFDVQVNGELKDDCTPLVQGIEYMSASHSEQMRANMEIVASMQKAHGISVPVFIDNSEACTWFPEIACQTIQLHVSEEDKKLRVELEGE